MSKSALDNELFKKLVSVAQFLFLAVAGWATTEIRTATHSINELNVTMAQLLNEVSNQKSQITTLESRVHDLELSKWKIK